MLAAFSLATATDRRWWSHWCSLGSPDTSTSFFERPLKKGQWTCHTHQRSQLPLVESGNCFGGHDIFGILWPQLFFCGHKTSLSGGVFIVIVALNKSVHNCCVPHQAPTFVPGAQSQAIRPPSIVSQADRLQGEGETNVSQ